MKEALEMETKGGFTVGRNAYVAPSIEIFSVEQQTCLLKQSFEGGHDSGEHNPGTPGEDDWEAKEFGFDPSWDGELWDF